MPEPLKNLYNLTFLNQFASVLKEAYPSLDKKKFVSLIMDKNWEQRELKQRMRHIAEVMHGVLPKDFSESSKIIMKCTDILQGDRAYGMNFQYMFFPDFIEVYGIKDYETSIKAMERITQFTSAEFAVRPFLIHYPEKMQAQMLKWSKHKHPMVRRLATEGIRPRLPWAMAVPYLKKDPTIILPILENLKTDEDEIVRRSVANNLNDIAKDFPEVVVAIASKWKGISPETDKLIRHACRTLLKRGNLEMLHFYGLTEVKGVQIEDLSTHKKKIELGDDLHFSFLLKIKKGAKLRIEYGVDYVKANGKTSRKIFKIAEGDFEKGEHSISTKQAFRDFTTRKHYPGEHTIAIIINGQEKSSVRFVLTIK